MRCNYVTVTLQRRLVGEKFATGIAIRRRPGVHQVISRVARPIDRLGNFAGAGSGGAAGPPAMWLVQHWPDRDQLSYPREAAGAHQPGGDPGSSTARRPGD
ncbi:hypothetical protein BST12_07960 [Mycobacterium angelicum]|uniref:Uncharacterized protein n=1 Tax=Mycobacterium angelicum TaxID=470074 RepID=A0A1W9ZYT0_MYCAN|nr:hypothetical protein BST12_07960 [Mycobacterium angelicum]